MGLLCMNPAVIGLLFTAERMTEGIMGFFIGPITERLGRKKSALIFLGINLAAQTILLFWPLYISRLAGYILFGIGAMKNSVCYVWLFESMETKNKSTAVTFMNMLDASTMVFFGIYVLFISRDWFHIEITMYCVSICAWLSILLMLPESPKWLMINGRAKEAHDSFKRIAKLNGKESSIPPDAIFIEQALAGHLPAEETSVIEVSFSRVHDLFTQHANALNFSKINESAVSPIKSGLPLGHQFNKQSSVEPLKPNAQATDDAPETTADQEEGNQNFVRYLLLVMFIFMINAYYMAYFNIETIEGNPFVNAMVLGAAEASAMFASGMLLLKVKEDTALRICCSFAGIANLALIKATTPQQTYIILLLAVIGLGGMFNCMYVVIEMQVSPKILGPTLTMIMTTGAASACIVPVMASMKEPFPLLITSVFSCLVLILSYLLPEGGKYLQPVVKLTDNVTVMDVVPVQQVINDTLFMPANVHTMGFNETFREKATGAQRARINESCIDPDMLNFNALEASKIIDKWKMDGFEESMALDMSAINVDKWKRLDL